MGNEGEVHKDEDAGFGCEVEQECDMWALWADACFLGEVEINEFGMELSSGEERR